MTYPCPTERGWWWYQEAAEKEFVPCRVYDIGAGLQLMALGCNSCSVASAPGVWGPRIPPFELETENVP